MFSQLRKSEILRANLNTKRNCKDCYLELGSLLPVGDQLEEGAGEQELGPRVIPLQQNTPANITKLVN
jgi:hypothetical protein